MIFFDIEIVITFTKPELILLICMNELANNKIFRTILILLHAAANFFAVSWCFQYDLTGSWLLFFLFIALCLLLLVLFTRHLISFARYLQSN